MMGIALGGARIAHRASGLGDSHYVGCALPAFIVIRWRAGAWRHGAEESGASGRFRYGCLLPARLGERLVERRGLSASLRPIIVGFLMD